MPGAVTYWLEGKPVQNLGDFLTELFLARVRAQGPLLYPRMRLIGSVISETGIRSDLRAAGMSPDGLAAIGGAGSATSMLLMPSCGRGAGFMGCAGR